VSNIGITPEFPAIYSQNTGQHSSVVQAAFKEEHKTGSYEYMRRVRKAILEEMPELDSFFQSGGLVDSVLNMGVSAPIDIQVSSSDILGAHRVAADIAATRPGAAGGRTGFHSTGRGFAGSQAARGSRPRGVGGSAAARSRQQCDHGAYLESDDRTRVLGRSESGRDYLLTVAISGKPHSERWGSEKHSAPTLPARWNRFVSTRSLTFGVPKHPSLSITRSCGR